MPPRHRSVLIALGLVTVGSLSAVTLAVRMRDKRLTAPPLAPARVAPEDRAEALRRSGMAFLETGQPDRAITALREYLKSCPADSERGDEATLALGQAYDQLHDHGKALAYYLTVVDHGAHAQPGTRAAEAPAHATFLIAEQSLPELEARTISTRLDEYVASRQRYIEGLGQVRAQYEATPRWQRPTWTLAAGYRVASLEDLLAKQLRAMVVSECPPIIVRRVGSCTRWESRTSMSATSSRTRCASACNPISTRPMTTR